MNRNYTETEAYKTKLEQVGKVLELPLNFMKDKYDHYVVSNIIIRKESDTILNSIQNYIAKKFFVTHDAKNHILYVEYYDDRNLYNLRVFSLDHQNHFQLFGIHFTISG